MLKQSKGAVTLWNVLLLAEFVWNLGAIGPYLGDWACVTR